MTEILIISIYFIFVMGVGVYSAFKIKKPEDYYVAGKKAGLIPVSGSLLATILGGSAILGTIELSQKIGWAALWFLFSASLGLFALIPLSQKVKRFGNFTLPELLGEFYGRKAENIASLIIPIAWLGIIAAQIIASAKILNGLGILTYNNAAIVSGAIFILYTLLGGQHSILKTDALQSVLIIAGIVVLLFYTIKHPVAQELENLSFSGLFNSSFTFPDLLVLFLTYSVSFVVGPDIYSRIFCAKSEKTAKLSVFLVAVLLIPVSFLITYLGVFSGHFENDGIVSFARSILPLWMYGIFSAALLSAVMSSADTTLLTSSMIIAELINKDLNNKSTLRLTKYIVIIFGILSIFIALNVTSIIQSLLFALTFFSGAFVIPVLAGLLQLRVNKKGILRAIILGGTIALSGKILSVFINEEIGNCMIVFSYFINALMLFWNRKNVQQKST